MSIKKKEYAWAWYIYTSHDINEYKAPISSTIRKGRTMLSQAD